MNSKTAIEEYKRFCRTLQGLSNATHKSQVLHIELREQSKESKAGTTPRTFHDITTPLGQMHKHIDEIFERHIGRLVVKEANAEVWSRKKKN